MRSRFDRWNMNPVIKPSDCVVELGITERRRKVAESALVRAKTPEDYEAALAAVKRAQRNHGMMLLKRDKLRRPHIYAK